MRRTLSAGILLSVLLLGSCAAERVSAEAQSMTPELAKTRIAALFGAVSSVIGPDGWTTEDKWVSCGSHDGDDYVKWTTVAQRFDVTEIAPENSVERVADAWRQLGLDPTTEADPVLSESAFIASDPPLLAGVHGDGSITQLTVSDDAAMFSASSVCFVGDIRTLR